MPSWITRLLNRITGSQPTLLPREQYKRVYWAVHQSATEQQWLDICRLAYANKRTVGFSADDAGIGELYDKTADLIGYAENDHQVMRDWYATNYPGTNVVFTSMPNDNVPPPDPPTPPHSNSSTLIGLHARADPGDISEAEFAEFRALFGGVNFGVIKVLSAHPRESVLRLANENPGCRWIVRSFLSWGGRNITPEQFYDWTRADVDRTVDALMGVGVTSHDIIIELHNEPNLADEGMWHSWNTGFEFGTWLFNVMSLYRANRPVLRLAFPGLSPGGDVAGIRYDENRFLSEAYSIASICNAICFHEYWSDAFPLRDGGQSKKYRELFTLNPPMELWCSEASRNDYPATRPVGLYAAEYAEWLNYVAAWDIAGVTFFVASASNPRFVSEAWVNEIGTSKGIAAQLRANLDV